MYWSYLAERVEYLVEVHKYFALCNLCNVVHALTCIVSDAGILVSKAGEDWWYNFFKVASDFLQHLLVQYPIVVKI
jgi:hypothetical protein